MEEETSKTFRPSPCWGQNLSKVAFEKKINFQNKSLQCASKIESSETYLGWHYCRVFKRDLNPLCQRNPCRAELETLSLCYVWSPIITPTRYIGGLSKETAPPPPRTNGGSAVALSFWFCSGGGAQLGQEAKSRQKFKNLWNWLVILMQATVWQVFNMKCIHWSETEILWIYSILLGKNSWNHIKLTYYFWRSYVIWNHCAVAVASSWSKEVGSIQEPRFSSSVIRDRFPQSSTIKHHPVWENYGAYRSSELSFSSLHLLLSQNPDFRSES